MEEKDYPYLYLDATYPNVKSGAGVTSMALLALAAPSAPKSP